ncbi:DUF924 family protein [Rhodoligotrophos defluvii]|uniref:DUF924 family protein n=1 Tax=Rhodoligotrophos defluvii TaxID=2561934 RepID=UPI0010C9428E|nr:DUF924 family protein [Rhodoligotrophos defluvii]
MTEPAGSDQTDTLQPEAILDFWLNQPPERWFAPNAAFDREIAGRFGHALEQAKRGRYDGWAETPRGVLALIILLDQFSRNIHRGTAEMYEADEKALALAKRAVAEGKDMALPAEQRSWIYLPFMHSENLDDQEACIRLSEQSNLDDSRYWAEIHADIIRRFGRFPHRNPILGRPMTEEEQRFLDEGGFAG